MALSLKKIRILQSCPYRWGGGHHRWLGGRWRQGRERWRRRSATCHGCQRSPRHGKAHSCSWKYVIYNMGHHFDQWLFVKIYIYIRLVTAKLFVRLNWDPIMYWNSQFCALPWLWRGTVPGLMSPGVEHHGNHAQSNSQKKENETEEPHGPS